MLWSKEDFEREVRRQLVELESIRKRVPALEEVHRKIDLLEKSQRSLLRKLGEFFETEGAPKRRARRKARPAPRRHSAAIASLRDLVRGIVPHSSTRWKKPGLPPIEPTGFN
jgi:hypothetical protein